MATGGTMFDVPLSKQSIEKGWDLSEITTEQIGFQALGGGSKLRLTQLWPLDNLPKPTSQLLAIASRQELLAAAGPDSLVLGTTAQVREAFVKISMGGDKQFKPALTFPIPRVSQVQFSADESCLILSAAEGGGLIIYDVSALKQGNKEPVCQLQTNSIPVRALVPNPASDAAHLIAVVLEQGQLMIANLKDRKFENGQNNSPVLAEGVSCVSWSNKGKQLTAGQGNGECLQITPTGELKARIPIAPQVGQSGDDCHVSGISWLENDSWLLIYAVSQQEYNFAPDSYYMYCKREKGTSNYEFNKLPDPCPPFGMNRSPPHHFITRMRDIKPQLTDILLLASTATGEVGMITNHQTPLTPDEMFSTTGGKYTTTYIGNDARKAQLPTNAEMVDTSPIGTALDLSSRDLVQRPIPSEEMDQSATPLPGYAVLNNEGLLSYWWFVYNPSVRERTGYQGLIALGGQQPQSAPTPVQPAQAPAPAPPANTMGGFNKPQPAFGQPSAFGQPAFGKPAGPAFGAPAFGAPSASGSTFGGASALGQNRSPWAAAAQAQQTNTASTSGSAFGQSGFAQAAKMGSPFAAMGGQAQNQPSPWATQPQQQQTENKPNPFAGGGTSSPFAAMGQQQNQSASPFAAMGQNQSASPFAGIGQQQNQSASPFAAIGQQNDQSASPFGAPLQQQNSNQSPFAGMSGATSGFGALGQNQPTPAWASQVTGQGTNSFGSTMSMSSNYPSSFGGPKSAWGTPMLTNGATDQSSRLPFASEQSPEAEMKDHDTPTTEQPPQQPASSPFAQLANNTNQAQQSGPFSGFKMQSSFKPDENMNNDENKKPAGQSLFGGGFGQALEATQSSNAPEEAKKEEKPVMSMFGGAKPAATAEQPPTKAFDGKEIKKEPEDEMPPAPLPPSPKPEERQAEAEPEPAPLPPSPKLEVNKSVENDAPLPPFPGEKQESKDEPELPPSPAGSSPVVLGKEGSSELSSVNTTPEKPKEDKTAAQDPETPEVTRSKPFGVEPTWGFPSDTPKTDAPTPSFTPTTAGKTQPTTTPFMNKPHLAFQPPSSDTESPQSRQRSPSPIRRLGGGRSFTSPSPTRRNFSTTPTATPLFKQNAAFPSRSPSRQSHFGDSARLTPTQGPQQQPTISRNVSQTSQKPASEQNSIFETEDDDTTAIKDELFAPIQPTKTLATFLAHNDYVGDKAGSSLPAQCEIIYRDINSMLDTLGLNARSMKSWVAGHEQFANQERGRHDLEKDEEDNDWSLVELSDLSMLLREVSSDLDDDRIHGVKEKLTELTSLRRELSKFEQGHYALQQTITVAANPDSDEAAQHASPKQNRRTRSSASPSPFKPPSSTALIPQQTRTLLDLRKQYTTTTTQLAAAEAKLVELRAALASQQANQSQSAGGDATTLSQTLGGQRMPTVESTLMTISKMTRMIEVRSGDLDVLEARMRRLRFSKRTEGKGIEEIMGSMSLGSSFRNSVGPGAGPRTPAAKKPATGTYAVPEDSDDDEEEGTDAYRTPMGRSVGSAATPRAAAVGQVSEEQIQRYIVSATKRARVMACLRDRVKVRGVRMSTVQ